MDRVAYLGHLPTVLWEFDADIVILKLVLIRLFRNGIRPFICIQTKQDCCQKDIWE